MLGLDLPDPALFHEGVFRNLTANLGTLTEGARQREFPHPCVRRLAIVRHVDHMLIKEVLGDLALTQTSRAINIEATTHMLATDINAALCDLASSIGGKELRGIVPLPLVAIGPISILQPFDRVDVFKTRQFPVERRCLRLQSCSRHRLEPGLQGQRPTATGRVVVRHKRIARIDLVAR